MRNQVSSWLIAFLFSIGSCHDVLSQSPEALKRKALIEDTDPGERKALLQAAWEMDTSNFEYRYDLAMSCIVLGFHWEALLHLGYIYEKDEGKIFPDNLYHQAKLYHRLGRVQIAQDMYEKYLRRHANQGCSDCIKTSRNELDKIKRLKKRKSVESTFPSPFAGKIDSISSTKFLDVNVGGHTQQVLIGSDSRGILFRLCEEDCETQRIPFACIEQNIPTPERSADIISKGVNSYSFNNGIFCSVNTQGIFTFTDSLGVAINTLPEYHHNMPNFKETTPTLNVSKDLLYFSSDRPGGFGGMDIWVSRREGNTWLPPENCGKKCNTTGDEVFPVVHLDDLYFSSDGHDGLGGLDIFILQAKSQKSIHLEEPFSSTADDVGLHFFQLSEGIQYAAWSSNRPVDEKADACCFHIWNSELILSKDSSEVQVEIETMKEISDNLIRKPLKLYFHNDEPDPRSKICQTKKDYETCLTSYINRKSEYYQSLENASDRTFLIPFFDSQLKASLTRMDSLLEEVQRTLQDGMNVALFVRATTSARASSEYNQCLSERRISAFQNSLEKWHEGTLLPYINKTQRNRLTLITRPLGEDSLLQSSGDEIYSYTACLSRRIEVEQLLSGENELLAPSQIQFDSSDDKISFILVNISDLPLQPVITHLPENMTLEGIKEIASQHEINLTLRRLDNEGERLTSSYKIEISKKGVQQVEITFNPIVE